MSVPDYYSVLGMPPGASQEELKKKYRVLMARYHPDRNSDPGAEEHSKRINEAYGVLSDPEKRARYDRSLHSSVYAGSGRQRNASTYGGPGGNSTYGSNTYGSSHNSYGNFTYRTYTYRPPDEQRSADDMVLPWFLLRSVLKVAALLLVLWLIVNFFVLFIFLAFMFMFLYLLWIVMGQVLSFFLGRR